MGVPLLQWSHRGHYRDTSLTHQNEAEVVSGDMSHFGHSLDISIEAFTTRTTGYTSTTLSSAEGGSTMDSLEIVTYMTAGLGVIVLGLCIIVASLLIYLYCRKLKGPTYSQVDVEENGVVPKSFQSLPTSPPNQQDPQIDTLDEVDKTKYKKNKKIPSVKIRLFRRNSGAKRKSTMEFDANDFDVPMPKASRPKRVAFNPRISRSDWDIYDSKGGSDMREELEMLLSRNSKDLSIRSKSPEVEEDFKSQYFDALETLSEDEEEDVPSQIVDEKETNEDIVESAAENTFDLLPGRYLMASSENFDDFMKALGVGMIKRKLANSVIPVNEIEIAEDGQYTIRTVTTVRTTEINFKLNEPFIEDTIDGRKTQTIPTRDGNLLKLYQKGDKSKGEKDSVMTRDLVGDVITMKLIVDNVVCTRIYK